MYHNLPITFWPHSTNVHRVYAMYRYVFIHIILQCVYIIPWRGPLAIPCPVHSYCQTRECYHHTPPHVVHWGNPLNTLWPYHSRIAMSTEGQTWGRGAWLQGRKLFLWICSYLWLGGWSPLAYRWPRGQGSWYHHCRSRVSHKPTVLDKTNGLSWRTSK